MKSSQALLDAWIKIAMKQGWTVKVSGHCKWYRPDGTLACTTPSTPGGTRRGMMNTRADLRRAGLKGI